MSYLRQKYRALLMVEMEKAIMKNILLNGYLLSPDIDGTVDLGYLIKQPQTQGTDGQVLGLQDGNPTWVNQQGEKDWELINEITLSEPTGQVIINKDINDNAFNLKEYYLKMAIKADEQNASSGFFWVYNGSPTVATITVSSFNNLQGFRNVEISCSLIGKRLTRYNSETTYRASQSDGAGAKNAGLIFDAGAPVKSIRMLLSGTQNHFGTGTEIWLYGVRV